jgi:uncharacterized membrane protein YdjX (TVP38/TMEM64 family)
MTAPMSRPGWPKLVIAFLFVATLVAFLVSGGARFLSLDAVKMHAGALRAFTETHYFQALALSFAVYVTAASLSLPSGTVLSLTFGFLFGRWIATAFVVTAATLGATILFLVARYLFGETVRQKLGKIGERIDAEFTQDGFSWLLFMRLMPVFPYFLVNLIPALTAMRARTFMAATLVGILPSTLIVTNLGQALGNLESTRGLLKPETLIALSLFGLLALLPVLFHHLRSKKA